MNPRYLTLLVLTSLVFTQSHVTAADNWPRWRGAEGQGHSGETNLPTAWDDSNVVWRSKLPGSGQSSPVIWGNKIFLTGSLQNGGERLVFCIDRQTGKILWQQTAWTGEPEPSHKMNNWASSTCATDGKHVIAFFGKGGIHCYDVEGKHVWSRDLGPFKGPWGTAASPILVGNKVIQNCDADDTSYLLALDKATGKELWRTPRKVVRGWSTPILIKTDKREELVMNGHYGTAAYDPETGKELWFNEGSTGRGSPTVVTAGDLIIAVNGRPGSMYAVRPGGSGTVNASHEVWRVERKGGRDLPSPIVVDDFLFVVNLDPGIGTMYRASTGEELWKARMGGRFSSSPIAAGGLIYFVSEDGEAIVIKPDVKPVIVSRNAVNCSDEEIFRASLVPHDSQLLLRSDTVLYCIGK